VSRNFGESPPTIVMVMVQIYIQVCMYYGYDMGKIVKPAVRTVFSGKHVLLVAAYCRNSTKGKI
jgi:hypothetical protein